jgi:hypothetical protein
MQSNSITGQLASRPIGATCKLRSMVSALASNVSFVSQAHLARVTPVILLHVLLLPVSAYRLTRIVFAPLPTHCNPLVAGDNNGE